MSVQYLWICQKHMSKAFDALNDNLPLANLSVYGFSLGLFHCYEIIPVIDMREHIERTSVYNHFSTWGKFTTGVSRYGLSPMSFNILILFYIFIFI